MIQGKTMGRFAVFNAGFTLVELLVVVTIIGVLAGAVAINSNTARQQARDNRRESDLENIAGALELYRTQQREYPASLNQLVPDFIDPLPEDPLRSDRTYQYIVQVDRRRFALNARLERPAATTLTSVPSSTPTDTATYQTGYYQAGDQSYHYRVSGH